MDGRSAVVAEVGRDPVADGRVADRVGGMVKPARALGAVLATGRQQPVEAVALGADAGGVVPLGGVRRERRLEVIAPAELGKGGLMLVQRNAPLGKVDRLRPGAGAAGPPLGS